MVDPFPSIRRTSDLLSSLIRGLDVPSSLDRSWMFGGPSFSSGFRRTGDFIDALRDTLGISVPRLARSDQQVVGQAVQAAAQQKRSLREQRAQESRSPLVEGSNQPSQPIAHASIGNLPSNLRPWGGLIAEASQATGVPAPVIAAIMQIESGGRPDAQSPMNYDAYGRPIGRAQGLMQVMPFHFKPGEDPLDPRTNIMRGAEILARNFARYGDWNKAAAAYFGAIDANGNIIGATDVTGTSGHSYVQRFNQALAQVGGLYGKPR